MKTSELTGAALDWAIAKCEGVPEYILDKPWRVSELIESYSTDWAKGGPIIEREMIAIDSDGVRWTASVNDMPICYSAKTPLIAAMRCYVASKLGDTVEIPRGLE